MTETDRKIAGEGNNEHICKGGDSDVVDGRGACYKAWTEHRDFWDRQPLNEGDVPISDINDFRCGFVYGYQAALDSAQWVAVSERLPPKEGKWYFVTVKVRSEDLDVLRAWYSFGEWNINVPVLAWMESPPPYKPEPKGDGDELLEGK